MLQFIKNSAKLGLNVVQTALVALARAGGLIDFPAPPNSSMRKTSSRNLFHYYKSGLTTYLPIVTAAKFHGVGFGKTTNVLDFGCGVGRQLLHMTRNCPEASYFACDVDSTLVDFIKAHYPMVDAYVNSFTPPLRFSDDSMDLIYSVSTFSHFDLATQELWLRELFRVVKPGGVCLLTVEGYHALAMMHDVFEDQPRYEQDLKENGILYKEYWYLREAREHEKNAISAITNRALGIDGSYGNTVMTPDFVKRNWSIPGFEVLGIVEAVIDERQDLVVLRKPVSAVRPH